MPGRVWDPIANLAASTFKPFPHWAGGFYPQVSPWLSHAAWPPPPPPFSLPSFYAPAYLRPPAVDGQSMSGINVRSRAPASLFPSVWASIIIDGATL